MADPSSDSAAPCVPLATKVAFLRRPDSYPEASRGVEAIETHMSWVFLTDAYAYKLKKPVRYDFLDFGTVEARRFNCAEDVRLNRRLAPDVALGIVALRLDPAGALSLNGTGQVVDWLVKMRRLPRERMLDKAIRAGRVPEAEIDGVAARLARFYRDAPPVDLAPRDYCERFRRDIAANRDAVIRPDRGLPAGLVDGVTGAQLALIERAPELLEARAARRRIVEAHGDLRPEHICLGPPPVIIDCLEFNREFRLLDPVDELSFLAIECEFLDAAYVGARVLRLYPEVTGDEPPDALVAFYKCYRACLRAKLAIWHLSDDATGEPAKWIRRARAYLDLADVHAEAVRRALG